MQVCESVNYNRDFSIITLLVEHTLHKVWTFKSNVTMGQGFALVRCSGIGEQEQAPISLGPFYTYLQVTSDGEAVMAKA